MAEEQKSDAPAPKKKPLLLIIAIVVAALAAGGGVYFFVGGKKDKAEAGEHGEKGEHGEEGEGGEKLPAQYVKLDPPFVVNFEAKGLMRFLQVTVEVMTRDPHTAELLEKNNPMIRNDLIMLFGSQKYEDISTREGKEKLRADALSTVGKIIESEGGKANKVEQLYFTSFVMQ